MFQIDYFEDGSVEVIATTVSPDSEIQIELPNISHTLHLDAGETFTLSLEKRVDAQLRVDESIVHQFTGSVDDIESKLHGIEVAKDRYISGDTWILELENELEDAMEIEDIREDLK
jgi:hypothetical protein